MKPYQIGMPESIIPQRIKDKGWIYKDFPKLPRPIWETILAEIGPDNLEKITEIETIISGNSYMRG